MTPVNDAETRARSHWLSTLTQPLAAIRHAARAVYPGNNRFHQWRRIRLWLRALACWHSTRVWLERCTQSSLHDLVRRHPGALERIHRPFLHSSFNARERLTASLDHHLLTHQRVPHVAARIDAVGSARIASFTVGEERWNVSLESSEQFQREGDWTLCIRDVRGQRIVSCTFSLAHLGGKLRRARLCVGAVQGPDSSVNGRELFRALTRRWYGLRPKVLVIYLAQCVAASLDVSGTFIVSQQAHISANWRYCLRKRRVAADYDRLSIECGALARWNGWFVLAPPARYLAERQTADGGDATRRKRYALRRTLAEQIRLSVGASQTPTLNVVRMAA
ncbi:DUF535 family protein [Paraburkholderia xenovorans]|uniref:DUF535 family protein n=1 Tax=Paraburkholderia xenovorans TaxID=36873 RepID=UPI0038BA310A